MPEPGEAEVAMEKIRVHWDEMAASGATDCAKVDSSARTQRIRFEAFLQLHDLNRKSLLDVGCGVGDLWAHLRRRRLDCNYLGVDISAAMVERCRQRFPEARFETANILEWDPGSQFDYVVAIGIHSDNFEGARELLECVTRRQFELCRHAAHLSILTDRYSGFAPHMKAWRAEEVLTIALDITPYVILRHDYLPNSFSITMYREPLIDTRRDLLEDLE